MQFDVLGINILSAAMGAMIINYFLKSNLDLQISNIKKLLFVTIFGLLNGFVSSLLIIQAIKPIILLFFSVLLIKLLLNASLLHSFLSFALYIIGLAVGNALIPIAANLIIGEFTVKTMQNNPMILLLGNIFANVIVFSLFIVIKPLKYYIEIIKCNNYLLILTAITIFVISSAFALHYYMKIFNLPAYLIIASLTISYCGYIIISWANALQKTIREVEINQQNFYNESLNSTLFNLRRFKHDWSNNLTVINSMLAMNKINELKQYLSELINQSLEEGNTAIYNIKNAGLFGIISSKLNQARDMGVNVDFTVVGEVESIPGIKVSELCEVTGIFLDNAMEEASNGAKEIKLSIYNDDSFLEISISNCCVNAPDMAVICKEGYSSKGEGRGMGLAIAKKIIEKYKNILHISEYEDNIFTQTITIEKGL